MPLPPPRLPALPGPVPESDDGVVRSRHLGEIELQGGRGGGWLDATMTLRGAMVPMRLEIDFPDRFDAVLVAKIDMAIDALEFHDDLARQTIAAGLDRAQTAPARLFRAWSRAMPQGADDPERFMEALRPKRILMTPDGGKVNRTRVVMDYALADGVVRGLVTVRFVQPTGPELAPASGGGFG